MSKRIENRPYQMGVVIEIEDVQIDYSFLNINYHPNVCLLRRRKMIKKIKSCNDKSIIEKENLSLS